MFGQQGCALAFWSELLTLGANERQMKINFWKRLDCTIFSETIHLTSHHRSLITQSPVMPRLSHVASGTYLHFLVGNLLLTHLTCIRHQRVYWDREVIQSPIFKLYYTNISGVRLAANHLFNPPPRSSSSCEILCCISVITS